MADETASIEVTADTSGFVDAFYKATAAVNAASQAATAMSKAYAFALNSIKARIEVVVSLLKKIAITAVGAFATFALTARQGLKGFSSFETAMANVATVMDQTKGSLAHMSQEVMNMTKVFPQSAEELASGLYEVNSAGFQGERALSLLAATARFSKAGLVDMSTSVRGTASILNAYKLNASEAAHVTDVMFMAVNEGAMTASEFTQNIGDWASSAAALKLPFETAGAALAVMTTRGALPAAQAATSLNAIMRAFIRPSADMSAAMRRMGFTSAQAGIKSMGFAKSLKSLFDSTNGNLTTFASMFQDVEGFKGALGLVTNGYDALVSAQDRFNQRGLTNGQTQKAFLAQMNTLSAKSALFGNQIRVMSNEIGKVVAPIAKAFVSMGTTVLGAINSLPPPLRKVVTVVQLIGPALMVVVGAMAAFAMKAFVMQKAMAAIAATDFVMAHASVGRLVAMLSSGMGPINLMKKSWASLTQAVMFFARANDVTRLSMLKSAGSFALYAAGMALIVTAAFAMVNGLREADAKAQALQSTFANPIKGGIDSLKKLNDERKRASEIYAKEAKESGGNSIWGRITRATQTIIPLIDNTKMDSLKAANAMADLSVEYQDFQALVFFSGSQYSEDNTLAAISKLAADGTVNVSQLIAKQKELNDLVMTAQSWDRAGGLPDLIFAQAAANSADIKAGKPKGTTKVNPMDYLTPEFAAVYLPLINEQEKFAAVVALTTKELIRAAQVTKLLDDATFLGSVHATNMAQALVKVGDAASTSSDIAEAFSAIVAGLFGMGVPDAQSNLIKSVEAVGAVMRDSKPNFDIYTAGGQELQSVLSGASGAMQSLLTTTQASNGDMNQAALTVGSYASSLVNMGKKFNYSNTQIQQMLTLMGITPESINTMVNLPGVDDETKRLLTYQAILMGLDGSVSTSTVVTNYVDSRQVMEDRISGKSAFMDALTGKLPKKTKPIIDPNKILSNLPKKDKGGGGSNSWAPTKEQSANIKDSLSKSMSGILGGEFGDQFQKTMAKQWYDQAAANIFAEGKTRLGAGILREAAKAKTDPKDQINEMVDQYNKLKALVGKDNADIALGLTDSLDAFKQYVDDVESMVQHQQDIENWKHDNDLIGLQEYKDILSKRLAATEEYSSEWMGLQNQMKGLEQDIIAEDKRVLGVKLGLNEISKADYLLYLRGRLADLKKYSSEWASIWDEIKSVEQQVIDETKAASDAAKGFADSVVGAFNDIKNSAMDPIIQATSVVAAFGNQADVTSDQIAGFYSNMVSGTQRWADDIKQLKDMGLNPTTLNDLIKAGPQSVGFADSLIKGGQGTIDLINKNVGQINDLASGFGNDIAQGSVSTVVQNDNSVTIKVGDISIVADMPTGLTLDTIKKTVTDAINGVVSQVQNKQPSLAPA